MRNEYYEKLVFFLNYSGIGESESLDLDLLSDEELKVLHDIVYANTEEEKLEKIKSFYERLDQKEKKIKQKISHAKKNMEESLNNLTDFLEKTKLEQDFLKQMEKF